jgi:phosphate/sulfate permease
MPQVGILSMITEFVGAVALGSRVTGTIKNGIINIKHFDNVPATLILTMGCAEVGSATWLMLATSWGMPVSTTQTVVGALVGAGIAAQAQVKWQWASGSVSQIAASWGIAPLIAAAFSAIIFATLKFAVLERKESFKWAMRLIPFYLAFTAAILALFLVIELPTSDSLEEFGAGKVVGIVLGVFAGSLLVAYGFFMPYFHRRLVKQDTRIRSYHIPLGPLLWRENPPLYFPAKDGTLLRDYSGGTKAITDSTTTTAHNTPEILAKTKNPDAEGEGNSDIEKGRPALTEPVFSALPAPPDAREKYLTPTEHLSNFHPKRIFAWVQWLFWRGVMKVSRPLYPTQRSVAESIGHSLHLVPRLRPA